MFTNSTKYAIRTVLFLAENNAEGKKFRVVDMAEKLQIPKQFLSKILQKLTKQDLISSTKGRNGGFFLTEENLKYRLLDIIVCIEGKNIFDDCILGLRECNSKDPCTLHHFFIKFKDEVNKVITDPTIGEILK